MDLFYRSTRSKDERVTASQAILQGLAQDGGLFVPESVPKLDKSLEELSKMNYQETAYEVMKLFLTDFTKELLYPDFGAAYQIRSPHHLLHNPSRSKSQCLHTVSSDHCILIPGKAQEYL